MGKALYIYMTNKNTDVQKRFVVSVFVLPFMNEKKIGRVKFLGNSQNFLFVLLFDEIASNNIVQELGRKVQYHCLLFHQMVKQTKTFDYFSNFALPIFFFSFNKG